MRFSWTKKCGLLLWLLPAIAGGLPGAEPDSAPEPAPRPTLSLPSAPGSTVTPEPGPSAAEQLTDEFLVSQLPSPVTPTRAQLAPGQAPATAVIHRETHQIISIADSHATDNPANVTALSKDDRLAAIAQQDLDFFNTLNDKPDAWPEAERNQRAQAINDAYADFLAHNPADISGLILYGKFLRHVGERQSAFKVFEQVNGLDPKIAVVKQQMANYLAEEGSYSLALGFILEATTLAPDEPIYHYQLGELLNIYYDGFLADKAYTVPTLNQKIDSEFARAAALDPQESGYAWRHAECYYDMLDPDWNAALAAWNDLDRHATSPVEQQVIRLHRARVLLELGRRDDARPLIEQPVLPALEATRAKLAERLAAPPVETPANGLPPGPATSASTPSPAAPTSAPAPSSPPTSSAPTLPSAPVLPSPPSQ